MTVGCGIGSHPLSPRSAKYQSSVYQTEVSWQPKWGKQAQIPGFPVGRSEISGWSLDHYHKVLWKDNPPPSTPQTLSQTPHYMTQLVGSLTSSSSACGLLCTHSLFQHTALQGQLCPRFSVACCNSHTHGASFFVLLGLGLFWLHAGRVYWASAP